MGNLKTYIFCFMSLVCFFQAVHTKCSINAEHRLPLFVKNFGSKQIFLPNNIRDIELESGEIMEAHCSSGISLRTEYDKYITSMENINTIIFYCNSSTLSFLPIGGDYERKNIDRYMNYVSCEVGAQQLYESNKNLPNCENYASYAIGIAVTAEPQIISAGICYDLENLSIKYVTYMGYSSKYIFLEQKTNSTKVNALNIQLDNKLTGFNTLFTFMSQNTFNKSYEALKEKNPLLQLYDFEYVSLLQDASLQNELKDYQKMFNIIWWRNLRLGNWNLYLKALGKQVQNTTYTIYTGISGVLKIPNDKYDYQEELIVQSEDNILRAPAYIWSYMNSSKEEFVIIASNSPFLTAENSSSENNICKDICHEIDWLARSLFARTRLIPTMGLIHCCHIKDVANKLENFPVNFEVQPKPTIKATTSKPETTTTSRSTREKH